jgi:hypothetical protein
VEKVPSVVGGTVDFATLVSTTLFAKVLARGGCVHTTEVQNEAIADVATLGETSGVLQKSLHAFMGSFWPYLVKQQPNNWRRIAVRRFVSLLQICLLVPSC